MAQSGTSKPPLPFPYPPDSGRPNLCVPVLGRTEQEVLSHAALVQQAAPDLVEWRLDYLSDLEQATLNPIFAQLHHRLNGIPLLVTFRSKEEGGEQALSTEGYADLLTRVIESGQADLVDVEFRSPAAEVLIQTAHRCGVPVICSSHEFHHTPTEEELLTRMERMLALGCDIPKLAVMPEHPQDVLTLLSATTRMHERYPKCPIITMSMGQLGVISRLCGGTFGSAVTFGCAGQPSAPGQIPATQLRDILALFASNPNQT